MGNGAGGERSPEFYAGLVQSRAILRQVVTSRFSLVPSEEGPDEADLMTYYEVRGETDEERIERAIISLSDDLAVSTEFDTGIVGFSVTTPDPLLSMGVAALIFKLVNDFDLTTRQSQASAERLFAAGRLTQLNHELREVEDSLRNFLLDNRVLSNSSPLQFEYDRLQREVGMRQELVTSMAQAFENARIEEVRNTPVITLIEAPQVPAIRDPKGRIMIMVVGLMTGAMLGAILAFARTYREEDRVKENSRTDELFSMWSRKSSTG